ncbi:MAG: methionine--tRNA ligase [Anaerolineae bacterium]|nr:methionine--tRNA ligase [Anaerolineae bacterium]
MSTRKKVLVSVAWPYANGDLHVGHLAGAYLPADIFARYHRLVGNDVLMVSGSDSHGTPVTLRAEEEGISPHEVFERFHRSFLETQRQIGISYDLFTHTDTRNHHTVSQDMFLGLLKNGYVYRKTQQQFYSETLERFLPDRYVEGVCPHCGYEEARGDQCDNCGKILDALELGNPRSKIDGSVPVIRETEHFFLDLAKLGDAVLAYLEDDKEGWRQGVLKFSQNYAKSGLRGRPITRDISWGIEVPVDGYEGKRLYVWFEAVIGYLSASIEAAKLRGTPEAWKDWWYGTDAETYYFIGKDNTVFHTVIWPAELIGVGRLYEDDSEKRLNLPTNVPANEFMNLAGAQFSKSRGHMITLPDLLSRYDADALRFYVTVVMPETSDSDFLWDDFVQRNNGELVGVWGNLAHRVLSFTHRHFGEIPIPGGFAPVDQELLDKVKTGYDTVGEQLAGCNFRAAMSEALGLAREVNRYLEVKAPWSQIKEDRTAAATTLYVALQAIDVLKTLLAPFLPFSSEALHSALGYEQPLFGAQLIETVGEGDDVHDVLVYDREEGTGTWSYATLPAGRPLKQPQPLFKKLDDSVVEDELARMKH